MSVLKLNTATTSPSPSALSCLRRVLHSLNLVMQLVQTIEGGAAVVAIEEVGRLARDDVRSGIRRLKRATNTVKAKTA